MRILWSLRLTYCDHKNNRFLTLGGAAWNTEQERDANLNTIPTSPTETDFVLDIMSEQGIDDDRFVDQAVVEKLLGQPIEVLIHNAAAAETRQQQVDQRRMLRRRLQSATEQKSQATNGPEKSANKKEN